MNETVERGFNINKDILIENLSHDSLTGLKVNCIISQWQGRMILSCKMAYQKYHQKQERKKSISESSKRKLKEEEIGSAKQKKLDLINRAMEEIEADI